jgi:hypothetical protein
MVAQFVCPFCGTVSDNPHGPCRQCGMENSQATRAATRSKIGPWFVLQVRNPSAPGMNWSTLISLIERGRITPRSIVRGPTTGQLWRFAARVKGVSREFGTCWHCGDTVQRDARLCPSCKRLQQLPANPDAMLETDLYAPPIAPRTLESEVPPPLPPAPEMKPLPVVSEPTPPPVVPVIDVDDTLPSGMEMRAFSLPDDYALGARPRARIARKLLFAAVIAILCGIAAGGYSPAFRDAVIHGYHTVMAKVTGRPQVTPQPPSVAPVAPNEPVTASHKQTPATKLMNVHTQPIEGSTADVQIGPSKIVQPRKQPKAQPKAATSPANASSKQAPTGGADIQIFSPASDPQAAANWAWQLRDQAIQYERDGQYVQALHDYERIRDLRLPDGVGPSDIQERLDRVKALVKPDNH